MKKIAAILGTIAALGMMAGFSLHTPAVPPHPIIPTAPALAPPPAAHPVSTLVATGSSSTSVSSSKKSSPHLATKPTEIVTDTGAHYPIRTYHTAALSNDPGSDQWWVNATDLPSAWARGYGNYQTTVAIIDTGFALNHEDLAGRWATNSGEQGPTAVEAASQLNCTDRGLPISASCNRIDEDLDNIIDNETGATSLENPSLLNCTDRGLPLDKSCNLIDDDGNGYADDVTGWDFANFDPSVQAGQTDPNGSGTMHGTMTSGTLGAIGNNGKGIAGVNWNTRILPIQALDDDSYGNTLTLARGIFYAVSRHADIISISLGASEEDPYVRQAIDYALSNGVIVVAAAGNEGCDCISYPARYEEVLSVGSQGESLSPSSFSNFGASLDLLAPGENMTLPAWSATHPTNTYISGAAGTSFAAPYVAGLLAQLKSLEPSATYGELVAALNETATHTGLSPASPRSDTLGYGLVNAGRSTARVTTPALGQRYQYAPLSTTTIWDSSRVYDCQGDGTFPSTQLFELSKGTQIIYENSEFQRDAKIADGWMSRSLGYQCIGQSIDTPNSTRSINLLHEIRNDYSKQ